MNCKWFLPIKEYGLSVIRNLSKPRFFVAFVKQLSIPVHHWIFVLHSPLSVKFLYSMYLDVVNLKPPSFRIGLLYVNYKCIENDLLQICIQIIFIIEKNFKGIFKNRGMRFANQREMDCLKSTQALLIECGYC